MDNTDTEESRHTWCIGTAIGFQIRGISDGPEKITHIFNRTILVVGVSKKLSTCLVLKLSSKHDYHSQGSTNLSRYVNSLGDNGYEPKIDTCKQLSSEKHRQNFLYSFLKVNLFSVIETFSGRKFFKS